ncbi:hypothetical protein QBC37DRAFT_281158 [Rhypophila decipiens]|uniref:Uncharacterized protein n=1 Tax=Rhypophila decipiens TaxID=261697 RepID=A0AAN6YAH4_9PEZI|nr:hypothetical protein QBC37DRAFT_281158 [Rhypophila decipiens]
MGGTRPPFIYEAVKNDDSRFQSTTFDPKAVTRASYENKAPKPRPEGPLVTINRHPDAHGVPSHRSRPFKPMGRRTKNWIRYMRKVQLVCRALELVGTVGMLLVMILVNNIDALAGWVLRITLGVNILHCAYAVFHLSRPAGGRTPGSSAAYHVFAGVSDLAILPLYAYGALTARNQGESWATLLHDETLVPKYFIPAVYYGFIGAGSLHLLSLAISLWLSIMFRRIVNMPPDMNPLESNLTSRAHKRNKSSVVTTSTYTDSEKCLDSALGDPRLSVLSQADLSRPPSVPFMHTRQGSQTSIATRDSRFDLPSRQYQITPGNSPRNSATASDLKRMSAPVPPRSSNRTSYAEIPTRDIVSNSTNPNSRPSSSYHNHASSGSVASYRAEQVPVSPVQTVQPRAAKFTEAWYASESLINRTQERTRALAQLKAANKRRAYEALNQPYDAHDESDSENDENDYTSAHHRRRNPLAPGEDEVSVAAVPDNHPNPLRSHPTESPKGTPPKRPYTPYRGAHNPGALSEVNLNDRRVSGSQDIVDQVAPKHSAVAGGRARDSSIQPEIFFYSKPYGDLRAATPPIMIPANGSGSRVVSSGNDYDLGAGGYQLKGRNVSGKIAEEGKAGVGKSDRWSRFALKGMN